MKGNDNTKERQDGSDTPTECADYRFETAAIHGGYDPVGHTAPMGVPVSRTAAYVFDDSAQAAALFALEEPGSIYTRIGNPTQAVLEERVAALEGGAAALALASGTSAVFYSIVNVCRQGDEVVSSANLYGGTYTMFKDILPQFGITVRFFTPGDMQALRGSINKRTRCVFTETIGNPSLEVADIAAVADVAHAHGLPLIVDSTFTTPYLLRPIEHGADIVVHSLTKWMGGHGTGIGGIVVDSGRFDWSAGTFPLLNEPDESYHGIRYSRDLGDLNPIAYIMRMRLVPLRNLGACIAPDNAWMFLQGIETLPLRMDRHCSNALITAEFLKSHPTVGWVTYPGLPEGEGYATARRYLPRGFGGMVVFGIRGGVEAGRRFIDALQLFTCAANVGDAKSLAIHPAGTTHSQLDEAGLEAAGIGPDMIRLSIGLEHPDDIIEDLRNALAAV